VLLVLVGLALLVGCSGGDDADQAPSDDRDVVEVGQAVAAGGASATVVSFEPEVEATAEVYAGDGERVAVEVEVCGDAEAVAGWWTLRIGDDELEPVPLPEGALPEANRPAFDFTAGPGPDGCRSGWVAWDLLADEGGEGVVVWEGSAEAGWSVAT
jgi:hypothetical protein